MRTIVEQKKKKSYLISRRAKRGIIYKYFFKKIEEGGRGCWREGVNRERERWGHSITILLQAQ